MKTTAVIVALLALSMALPLSHAGEHATTPSNQTALERFVEHQQEMLANGQDPHAQHACFVAHQGRVHRGAFKQSFDLASVGDPTIRIAEDDTLHSYNSLHLDIQLWLDIGNGTFDGVVTMLGVANEFLPSFPIFLKLGNVESVTVDGNPALYSVDGELVTVTPLEGVEEGEEFTVVTTYNGQIFSNLFDGGMVYHVGTNTLFTFGEPYDIRRFIACYDLPFDKVTSRMRVTLPEQYELVSNGVLQEVVDNGDGTRTHDWLNLEQTSTYLLAFAAHPYLKLEDDPAGQNDVPVSYWVYPSQETQAWVDFNRTDDMIDYFEPMFGVYPFVKYDQAMAAIFSGWGAMEHQTATTYGHNLIYGDRTFENIVAHELGHQWWGDMVGPRTFANIWLNEGFASYTEALWAENFGVFNRTILLDGFRQQYFNEDNGNRHALYDPSDNNLFSTTIYKKGAWVLHMLRWVVGDDDFFAGLTQYGEDNAFATAAVPDFQAAMESTSGMDLDAFFDEWVYQAGYPEYHFSGFNAIPNGDSWNVTLTVSQTQTNAPYFSTPLPIVVLGTNGEEQEFRVEMAGVQTQVVNLIGVDFEPDSFTFDPDQWILCTSTVAGVNEPAPFTPQVFELSQAWPNPFNNGASVDMTIARLTRVTARVYDLLGREVATLTDRRYSPGNYRLSWQPGATQASGTYLLRVETLYRVDERKLTLLR